MWRPFSTRRKPPVDVFTYTLSERVRMRILACLRPRLGPDSTERFHAMLTHVCDGLLRLYGELCNPEDREHASQRAYDHFLHCPDNQALDFIELCWRVQWGTTKAQLREITEVFRDEGIGYEVLDNGEIIRKDDEVTHSEIVKPCLGVLAKSVFKVANDELLQAFRHIRHGNFADALTLCNSAYESVLKSICAHKKWPYSNGDTTGRLVSICRKHGLFSPVYAGAMTAPGAIRGELSASHGGGTRPRRDVGETHANHMIHLTCANILFLVKSAKM